MFRTFFTLGLLLVAMPLRAVGPDPAALAEVDHIFAQWQLDAHVPGLVYGVFADGKLVHVKARLKLLQKAKSNSIWFRGDRRVSRGAGRRIAPALDLQHGHHHLRH